MAGPTALKRAPREVGNGIQDEPHTPEESGPSKDGPVLRGYLGAKIVAELGTNGLRLDLHGLGVNVTKLVDGQSREQMYGIEHIAVETDDMNNVIAGLKAGGARLLEEFGGDRRVCFFEGPDGVQLEVMEMEK